MTTVFRNFIITFISFHSIVGPFSIQSSITDSNTDIIKNKCIESLVSRLGQTLKSKILPHHQQTTSQNGCFWARVLNFMHSLFKSCFCTSVGSRLRTDCSVIKVSSSSSSSCLSSTITGAATGRLDPALKKYNAQNVGKSNKDFEESDSTKNIYKSCSRHVNFDNT